MLLERTLTALALLALLIPPVVSRHPIWFEALTALMIGAAGWEWGKLCGLGRASSLGSGAALFATCLAVGPVYGIEIPAAAWLGVTAAWIACAVVGLRVGPEGFSKSNRVARFVAGWALIGAAWAALAASRERGLAYLASVCALVWLADIAAYFVGRAIGRRKLAPTISPGKSWEGAIGGGAAVLLLAAIVAGGAAHPHGNLFWRLRTDFGWAGLLLGCAALVALAIAGDLLESLVKRAAGAKDSSRLLPGHGGMLDRIDALLPVLPAALALTAFF
ncbi:MAG: phosphatidate cytidylyltransferase [Burkholderiaceae bacterium]